AISSSILQQGFYNNIKGRHMIMPTEIQNPLSAGHYAALHEVWRLGLSGFNAVAPERLFTDVGSQGGDGSD
ncbi:unnamed protein product, partial [Symbiodinium sp. CCMP2592]